MSQECKNAVNFALRDASEKQERRSAETLAQLSAEYLRTKLEVLGEKVALLQRVEGMFDQERDRLEIEKKDLQVLRAQLALAQQNAVEISNVL